MLESPIFDQLASEICEHGKIPAVGCYHCCNVDAHRCHFCGDDLRHDGKLLNGDLNPCYYMEGLLTGNFRMRMINQGYRPTAPIRR